MPVIDAPGSHGGQPVLLLCCRAPRHHLQTVVRWFKTALMLECRLVLRCVFVSLGVQALLDGVSDYLPCPTDVPNTALDLDAGEQALILPCRSGRR